MSASLPQDSIARALLTPRELIAARGLPERTLSQASLAYIVLGSARSHSVYYRIVIGAVVALLA
ncbi:MAG: hypothetical protein AAGI01_07020, partial [Myxococcota bacterium]